MIAERRRPPIAGRILGGLFAASWLARLGLEIVRGRRSGFGLAAGLTLAGLTLTPLAPVLAHRNRFFGRLPHRPWQLTLVAAAIAGNWTALALLITGRRLGRLDPEILFASTTAAMLQSPFLGLVLGLPRLAARKLA